MIKDQTYYLEQADQLGWGQYSGQLDPQRLKLLGKFVYGQKILDVGCGLGLYVNYLSSQGKEGFGVDFVPEFITFAKKTKQGIFKVGRSEKLPFENGSFDTCLLFDILEHGDDRQILKEAKRVTRKRILAIVPRAVDSNLADAGVVFRHYLDKSHLKEYNEKNLRNLAKELDLKLVYLIPIHNLNNRAVLQNLFKGPTLFKKIICRIFFTIFLPNKYSTEYFVVMEK